MARGVFFGVPFLGTLLRVGAGDCEAPLTEAPLAERPKEGIERPHPALSQTQRFQLQKCSSSLLRNGPTRGGDKGLHNACRIGVPDVGGHRKKGPLRGGGVASKDQAQRLPLAFRLTNWHQKLLSRKTLFQTPSPNRASGGSHTPDAHKGLTHGHC